MRIEQPLLLIALVALALAATASAKAAEIQQQRTILFGVNYLPHVTCVEEFTPYWTTDNWTEKRMVTDFKIMKAIGCSGMRFHIYPAVPGKIDSHGLPGEKFLTMLDLGVKTAAELGMQVHLDIADWVDERGEEGVTFCLNRYKGKIQSYQIGNERWDYAESPEKLKWLQGLVELGHSIDRNAKISVDIMVPDWVKVRDEMPDLYRGLNPGLVHYYPVTDYHGWNQLYIDDLIDHLGNPTGRNAVQDLTYSQKRTLKDFGEYDAKAMSFDHDLYVGSWGWLDKEAWITEISSHGYWRWGNLTPEDKRAGDWQRVVDAVAGAKNRVTRIYHHCFRDKMNSREFGMGQSGIVYYDGSPRPATWAFKKMAVKYSPANSPMRVVDCEIRRVEVVNNAKTAGLVVKVTNKTAHKLRGKVTLELPDFTTATVSSFAFDLTPKASRTFRTELAVAGTPWRNNHVFARVDVPQGVVYGWGIIAKPVPIYVNPNVVLSADAKSLVRYPQGMQAVEDFLNKYGDDCAIITGPCLGSDAEMGYRLKTVLQAMRCREIPVKGSVQAIEVLNRPLIVIGPPEYNLISRTVEMAMPEDQRITATNPGAGKGMVAVVEAPFGKMTVDGRFSRQSEQLGYYFGACPAALYISGPDDEGTKAATYDLIARIWGKGEKYR